MGFICWWSGYWIKKYNQLSMRALFDSNIVDKQLSISDSSQNKGL